MIWWVIAVRGYLPTSEPWRLKLNFQLNVNVNPKLWIHGWIQLKRSLMTIRQMTLSCWHKDIQLKLSTFIFRLFWIWKNVRTMHCRVFSEDIRFIRVNAIRPQCWLAGINTKAKGRNIWSDKREHEILFRNFPQIYIQLSLSLIKVSGAD